MKRNIKRLSLALIALGLSAPVLADSSPFCVTVPNQQGGFTVGADVLWLRAHTPNFGFSTVTTSPAPFLVTTHNISVLNPGYHWAWDLMAAYRIPCTGNDISVLWTHYNNATDTASETHPIAPVEPFLFNTRTNRFSGSFRYDAVDLDLGQRVNFGDYFNFRIFTGVRGADIKTSVNRTRIDSVTTLPTISQTFTLDQDSDFRGFGPQMGIEGRYCVGYGFGIDASTTLSALVGRVNSCATLTTTTTPVTTTDVVNVTADKKNRVVPALDMNLGVDYTFNFNNCSRSSLVVQAGYKVIHYWNANDLLFGNDTEFAVVPTGGFPLNSSVSFDGPYLGIKVNV